MATQTLASSAANPAGDRQWLAWVWLLVGLVSGIFIGTRRTLPICAWIAPVFSLRFLELRKGWMGFLPYVLGGAAAFSIANYGVIPLPAPEFYRTIAQLDSASSDYPLLIASVPCRRIPTVYSWCGDSFAWLAVLGFVLSILGWFWRR